MIKSLSQGAVNHLLQHVYANLMRVVALIPGGISEQILFFPTLDDLKQSYPKAEIDVVVEPRAKSAYRISKSVDDVLTFDFKDRNSPADWANLLGVLRDRDYEAVLSSDRSGGAGLLLWLTGIPKRVGFTVGGGNFFLTDTVLLKPDQYGAAMYHDLLQGLGMQNACPELTVRIPKGDQDWADAERKQLGLNGYVLLYGGSTATYPIASWQKILQDFQEQQPDIPIVLLQDLEDKGFVADLLQAVPGLKVTKPGDVGKLAAMIAGANLLLGVEGTAIHLAVALQVYTLVLLGENEPEAVLPPSDKFVGLRANSGRLADLSPEQVLQKVWGG
ncbi:MAG: glycosyltransferase family 9 protein [Elainella sp. Prado103]|nr:glycosyltransferase family 9 protein [Elainella sp. Prado103]